MKRLLKSDRMADLAAVFPGAVYALAALDGTPAQRKKAVALAERGAPLKDVSRALDIPMWLRRLPPEAFRNSLAGLPGSDVFARRIANVLPDSGSDAAFWLESIGFAARAADDYFALWLAGQPVFGDGGDPGHLFGVLAAYAWHSTADIPRDKHLITVPWRPEMAFDTAVCAAKCWLNRIRLVLQMREGTITDPWLAPGEAAGFSFVPLLDSDAVLAEAQAMQNCADQYSERICREKCRLFSIRRRGVRVATLEIGPHAREAGILAISQLKSRHNMPAATEVWQATHAWMAGQTALRRLPSLAQPVRPLDLAAWDRLILAYRLEKSGARWLPPAAQGLSFTAMESGLSELARRGGVSSWLFT